METMPVMMNVTEENAETKVWNTNGPLVLCAPMNEVTSVLIDIRSPNNIADISSTHRSLGKNCILEENSSAPHLHTFAQLSF